MPVVPDARALAQAITDVIQHRRRYLQPREVIESHFSLKTTVDRYEALLERIAEAPRRSSRSGPAMHGAYCGGAGHRSWTQLNESGN
jgi:hypothetical protein